jgi:hypothetical protein
MLQCTVINTVQYNVLRVRVTILVSPKFLFLVILVTKCWACSKSDSKFLKSNTASILFGPRCTDSVL